jgi:hypothetical protein
MVDFTDYPARSAYRSPPAAPRACSEARAHSADLMRLLLARSLARAHTRMDTRTVLNNCIKEPHSHLAVFVIEREGLARLDFIQNMEYKFVELSCNLIASPEDVIRAHICLRYNTLKSRLADWCRCPSKTLSLPSRSPPSSPAPRHARPRRGRRALLRWRFRCLVRAAPLFA